MRKKHPHHHIKRYRQIASALARHGLGWLAIQLNLGMFIPFHWGLLGHPRRREPYTQAEHLRMALEDMGTTFVKLGQIHAARLYDDTPVAVKVQRPGVEARVEEELDILIDLARYAARHTEWGHSMTSRAGLTSLP